MRTSQEIQKAIQAHHDEAREKAVPVHFLTLINLQAELNAALLVELGHLQEAASASAGADVAAFMAKVNEALFKDDAAQAEPVAEPEAPAAKTATSTAA